MKKNKDNSQNLTAGRPEGTPARAKSFFGFGILALATASTLILANCTVRTPGAEGPSNSNAEEVSDKAFFVQSGKRMSFLCGWASEREVGFYSENYTTHNVQVATHCNVEFKITEKALVGLLVNPSFPDDQTRWKEVLSIPIKKHYYLESDKDQYGRETNRTIENDQRSDWSARPLMKLDFSRMQVIDWSFAMTPSGFSPEISAVEDIEWDKKSNFLGFTVVARDPILGAEGQGRFRVNFLKFDHNPKFKKTPFNDQNYKYMNVLHVVGELVNGTHPILYAAHWDMEKEHKVVLNNFPQRWVAVGEQVVAEWNDAMREMGILKPGQKGFVVDSKLKLKHPFDLRYPSITWVDDPRISGAGASPLGIAIAQADVRNGEILWGGINLYAAYLENYVKNFADAGSLTAPVSGKAMANISELLLGRAGKNKLEMPPGLMASALRADKFLNSGASVAQVRDLLSRAGVGGQNASSAGSTVNTTSVFSDLYATSGLTLRSGATQLLISAKTFETQTQDFFSANNYRSILKSQIFNSINPESLTDSNASSQLSKANTPASIANSSMKSGAGSSQSPSAETDGGADFGAQRDQAIKMLQNRMNGNVMCLERTLADVAPGWAAAAQDKSGRQGTNLDQAVKNVVKELISHEYGHFLGLGHQFKENIVPARGTVPARYLDGDAKTPSLAKLATKENSFTNMTSIMGYRDPRVEFADSPDNNKVGPQDKLVLKFLYKQKYATFNPQTDTEFQFADVPADGVIPPVDPTKPQQKTAYFPQCNDWEASLSLDPYCNRFDAGNSASEIIDSYLTSMRDSLTSTLFKFSDARGGDFQTKEYFLWVKSITSLGRVRLFYDFMRREFEPEIASLKSDEKALYEFSSACQNPSSIQNDKLKALFASPLLTQDPTTLSADEFDKQKRLQQLQDLCRGNATAIESITSLLAQKTSDYSRLDRNNSYVPGGIRGGEAEQDSSRAWGTLLELSGMPIKIASIFALTTPNPWVAFGPWMFDVPTYDSPDQRYSPSSLYPSEYTKAIALMTQNNLRFAAFGTDSKTVMGRSVMAMSYFNSLSQLSNDSGRFPAPYLQTIRNQNRFNFSFALILLDPVAKVDGEPFRYDKFNAKVIDLNSEKISQNAEAYLLPDANLVVSASNMIIYPFTEVQVIENDKNIQAYALGYKLDYSTEERLSELSVKSRINNINRDLLESCIGGRTGQLNGLQSFFNRSEKEFKGFLIQPGISTSPEKLKLFRDSVDASYAAYESAAKYTVKPNRLTCSEAIKGLAVLTSAAATLNGYWLPITLDQIEK